MDLLLETPHSYAKRLAGYIASPTKIEALTKLEFGRAPPLHKIAAMRYSVEQGAKPPRRFCKDSEADDGDDYAVPSPLRPKSARPRDYIVIADVPAPPATEPDNPFLGLYNTGARVIASVAQDFGLTPADITGKRKHNDLVDARAVVAAVLKRWGRRSYPEIGKVLGGRDHSTVIHAVQHFDIYCRRNDLVWPSYERHVAMIEEAERELAAMQEAEAA